MLQHGMLLCLCLRNGFVVVCVLLWQQGVFAPSSMPSFRTRMYHDCQDESKARLTQEKWAVGASGCLAAAVSQW